MKTRLIETPRSKLLLRRKRLRDALLVLSIVMVVGIMSYVIRMYLVWEPRKDVLPNKPFNAFTELAMEMRIDLSRSLFQISLVFIGALWGLLVAKKGESILVLSDYPELIMSISATILLILSSISHFYYINFVTDLFVEAGWVANQMVTQGIADIFEQGVNYLFLTQVASLIAGMTIAVFAFISAHKLKL